MEKQVTTKKANEVQSYNPALDLLKDAPDLKQEHLRIPKIKIHQGTTVGRQGMIGELFITPELTKLVGPGEKLVFYPLTYKLSWYHNKKAPSEQKPTPTGITPWESGSQFEWKKTDSDGTIHQNFQTATFFVILEKDLESGLVPTPHQIVLSSTNFTAAASPLMNRYAELKRNNIEPWLCKFELSSEQSKKGAWQVYKIGLVVDKSGQVKAKDAQFDTLRKWVSTLFEMSKKGGLEQKAEDLAADIDEADAKPLADKDLQF